MKNELLVVLGLVLVLAIAAGVYFVLRARRKPLPPTIDSRYSFALSQFSVKYAYGWRALWIAECQNRLLEDLHAKLLRDYLSPGGLRSQCLDFLQLMEEGMPEDVSQLRARLINACLYPLHAAVLRYDEMLSQARGVTFDPSSEDVLRRVGVHDVPDDMPEPVRSATIERNIALLDQSAPDAPDAPPCPLLDDLLATFGSQSVLALIGGQYEDLAACRSLLQQVHQDISRLVARHASGRALRKEAK